MSNTVVNLTNLKLAQAQLYTFYLSQSFTPTPAQPTLSHFEKDLL